jgi:hypothetical protein
MRILQIAISTLGVCAALAAPRFAHAHGMNSATLNPSCDGDKAQDKKEKKNPAALSTVSCDGDKAQDKKEKKNPAALSIVSCDGDKAKNEKSDKKI